MSFGSPAHHAKYYHGWGTSDRYRVSEPTVEVMPDRLLDGPLYPKVHVNYNNDYEERVVEAPGRVRVTEYEFAPQHHKAGHHHVHSKNVDQEAEDFIKLEHKMFELSKLMSMRTG